MLVLEQRQEVIAHLELDHYGIAIENFKPDAVGSELNRLAVCGKSNFGDRSPFIKEKSDQNTSISTRDQYDIEVLTYDSKVLLRDKPANSRCEFAV
jgi:hypothetical protein